MPQHTAFISVLFVHSLIKELSLKISKGPYFKFDNAFFGVLYFALVELERMHKICQ